MKRHRRQYEGISNCTMTLPSGLETWYLTGQLADWPMVVSTAVPAQVFRNLTASSIINIQSILAKDGVREIDNSTTFIASECVLVPCVQSYHAAVNGSDFKEQILQTWYNNTQDLTAGTNLTADDNQQLFAFVDPSEAPDKGVEAGQHFGITGIAYDAVQRYLSSLFSGYAIQLRSDFEFEGTPSGIGSSDALKAIYYGNFTNCENPADKVACAVGNVAKALSKSIRDAPYVVSGVDGAEMTKGQTLVPVTYIHVTWYWLSLPVVIWLLSITTLLGTAWKSRRAGVRTWRTNPLAMVFLGLDREEHAKVKHYGMTEKALSKKAKKLQVKLHVTEEGARLVNG
ncbi:hypothetical protein H2203_001888 [Taxawa tesnikishii (nom. ined.)]|nr:hypothetical protein H2203_001888 [Dothideales sp. JES 119]